MYRRMRFYFQHMQLRVIVSQLCFSRYKRSIEHFIKVPRSGLTLIRDEIRDALLRQDTQSCD